MGAKTSNIIIIDFMSINVPELSGKELCDVMDCPHTHTHLLDVISCNGSSI